MAPQKHPPASRQTLEGETYFQQSKPILSPTGKPRTATISTNDFGTPTGQSANKAFTTLAAQLALQGHQLVRSDRQDGAVTYYAHCWGHVRHLPDLDAVAAFVRQNGGSHV
jgi:hypothetical protein